MPKKKNDGVPKETKLRKNIYQSNPLIQARKGMNIIELRLFMIGLRGINPHLSPNDKLYDTEFQEVFVSTAKLTELFEGNTWYLHNLDKVCDKFFDAKIKLRFEDGGWELYHLFRKIKYVPSEGLYIHFEDLLRPYLLDLFKARGYTQIDVEQIFRLTSPYAVRLIEVLLQYQNIPNMKKNNSIERSMTVEEIRFTLNVPDGAYVGRMNNFRRFVIDEPIREINEKTSYKMRYEVLKHGGTGGRVYAFKFFLDTSALPHEESSISLDSSAVGKLKSLGFGEQAAQAIRDKCADDADCLKRITSATRSLSMKKKRGGVVENELGYLRKYIEEDWTQKSKARTEPTKAPSQPKPKRKATPAPAPVKTSTGAEQIGSILRGIIPSTSSADNSRSSESLKPPKSPKLKMPEIRRPAPEEFRAGEKPIASSVVEVIAPDVASGEPRPSVDMILSHNGLTLERFKKLYLA